MRREIVIILSVLVLVVSLVSAVSVIAGASYEAFTDARSGNVESANNVTSIEVAKPAGTASGDLLIGVVITDGDTSGNFTAPTDWTLIDVGGSGSGNYGEGCTLGAWYLIAGNSEPSSYQWTWTTSETVYAFIIRITGHDMDNPIDAWSSDTGTDGFSATCPAVNTTVADTLVLRIFGYDSCYAWNTTYPDEHAGITVESSRPGCEPGARGHCSGGAAYAIQATAGDTGTADFQVTQGEGLWAWRTLTIAVRPASVQYDLTMAADPEEGGTATDLTNESPYEEGTVVSIKAEANEGYGFVNWEATVGEFEDDEAAETTFTMPAQNVTVTANFELEPVATTMVLLPESGTNSVDTTHNLTATVYDQFDNEMAGVAVSWYISGVGYFSGSPDGVTDADGEADAVITSSEPGISTVKCEVTGESSVSDTATKEWTYTPEATTLELLPETGENSVGTAHNLTATVYDQFDNEMAGVAVSWNISGIGSFSDGLEGVTDGNGEADAVITSSEPGISTVKCEVDGNPSVSDTATKEWTEEVPPLPEDPTVTTQAATGVSTASVTLHMSYTAGDFSLVQVRFAYKKSTGSAWFSTNWVSKSGNSTHAESVPGLSSDTEYDFKAQLKYDDTVIEGPTLQFTTDRLYQSPSTGCFIATAAYGTPTAEQIDVLREFRDIVLLESTAGSQFVALYYQLSPPVADFISESSVLRTLVRELLVDPIVWVVEATGDIWRN